MSKRGSDDYEVGYGKPPQHSKWRKGTSGNPKGRPKRSKNLKTDLMEELSEQIVVQEGGCRLRISKQRALIKTQVARALKGNDRAAAKVLELLMRVAGVEADAQESGLPLSAEEEAVLADLEARLRKKLEDTEPPQDDDATDDEEQK